MNWNLNYGAGYITAMIFVASSYLAFCSSLSHDFEVIIGGQKQFFPTSLEKLGNVIY